MVITFMAWSAFALKSLPTLQEDEPLNRTGRATVRWSQGCIWSVKTGLTRISGRHVAIADRFGPVRRSKSPSVNALKYVPHAEPKNKTGV
jgi:hypothetical protein